MVIEFNEAETRLLYNILVEQAAEHLSCANPSELAEGRYKLAARFQGSVTTDRIQNARGRN